MLVHSKSNFSSDLRRTGLLYEFLSILALNPLESDQQVDSEYMYINQAIEYIKIITGTESIFMILQNIFVLTVVIFIYYFINT